MSSVTTLPFAGGEMCSFDPRDASTAESTASGKFDSAYARCAISCGGNNPGAVSPTWTAAADFWFHAMFQGPNPFTSGYANGLYLAQFYASGVEVARIVNTTNSTSVVQATVYTLQSGVLTSVGSATWTMGTLTPLDIRIKAGASGAVEFYVSGTQQLSVSSLNHSGFAGITQVCVMGSNQPFTGPSYWSEIICDSVNHIGDRLATCPPTGAGTNTAWTGAYTDVDETVYSDADKITSTAANDIETFTTSASFTGIVKAVVVGARSNCGASGPQHIEMALRSGSTNYFGNSTALASGFQACSWPWSTDPNTSTDWVTADALSAQPGVKAIA